MPKSIRISEKHGVNPSMDQCPACGQSNGQIILPGRLPGDAEAPRLAVWTNTLCDACKKQNETHIFCIECPDLPTGKPGPPTGRTFWLARRWFEAHLNNPTLLATILKHGNTYLQVEVFSSLLKMMQDLSTQDN